MKFLPTEAVQDLTVKDIAERLLPIEETFVVFQTVKDEKAEKQMLKFFKNYQSEFTSQDIFYFLANPVYTQFLKKQEDKEPFLEKDDFQFIDKIEISIPTYVEKDPFLVLPENYSYLMFRRTAILRKVAELEENLPFEVLVYQLLQSTDSIVKERILEIEKEPKVNSSAELQLNQTMALFANWVSRQREYCQIPLLNQEFEINLLNYLINTRIGPAFQTEVEQGNYSIAREILAGLLQEIQKLRKTVVSGLVSLGYYFVQIPVEQYDKLHKDPEFMKLYLEFGTFLFSQMHFNSRSYYLRFYRQATNALYKAVRANSEKPLRKCNELYFSHQ
ncbi:hypothetical protein ACSMFR_08685 [Listeria aquatica]|uniref:hypothetical protein n=1 Tax=Listeria aquatica TaxID=1494960 RepID=UPI003F715537